ncbi:MAG: RNA polymerase sigma factor [Candidatus Falkowbacteria bacterium]|nr:RNA polymerase sigma factor [Candidatus Falkowbacteria bacterium]
MTFANKINSIISSGREKVLFIKVINKDKIAFSTAYDKYVDQIYRFIYFKISDKEEANDLTSLVFLKAWDYIQTAGVREVDSLKALFYKIARNVVIDFYRKKNNNVSLHDYEDTLPDSKNLQLEIENDFELAAIKRSMFKLKNEYREVLIFHYVDELSIQEIADILDKTNGNVRVLLHRALKTLQEIVINKNE